jgi:heptosyltransferase-2
VKDQPTTSEIKLKLTKELQASVHDLAGKTSLIEVVDLLGACKTVVSNDSGLMHVAAAVGCHVIGVYGSTSPRYTPPLAQKVDIKSIELECRPCFKRTCQHGHLNCLNKLAPEQIIASLEVN